jgi:hypothetical protein
MLNWLIAAYAAAVISASPLLAASKPDCLHDPAHAKCEGYQYPDSSASSDLQRLCVAMPFMSACTMVTACNASHPSKPVSQRASTCTPFNLLATACGVDKDMSGMRGCANYTSLCSPGSRVTECTNQPGLAFLPTTSQVLMEGTTSITRV